MGGGPDECLAQATVSSALGGAAARAAASELKVTLGEPLTILPSMEGE
jgi:hypothetical protein